MLLLITVTQIIPVVGGIIRTAASGSQTLPDGSLIGRINEWLIAGRIGGAIGLLVAIPSYTVLRVIASRFFYHWKPVRRLIPDREEERS